MRSLFLCASVVILVSCDGGNQLPRCTPTPPDVLGPYYYPDPPKRRQICERDPSFTSAVHLLVRGRVLNEDCQPLRNARIEIWQADHSGHYLFKDKCRGYLISGPGGHFAFMTTHPGKYSSDPKRELFRPAHVHYRVAVPGYKILVTQMYFRGDDYLGVNDSCTACSSDEPDLIVDPDKFCADDSGLYCFEMATFNLVLKKGNGIEVVEDIGDSPVELSDLILQGK